MRNIIFRHLFEDTCDQVKTGRGGPGLGCSEMRDGEKGTSGDILWQSPLCPLPSKNAVSSRGASLIRRQGIPNRRWHCSYTFLCLKFFLLFNLRLCPEACPSWSCPRVPLIRSLILFTNKCFLPTSHPQIRHAISVTHDEKYTNSLLS